MKKPSAESLGRGAGWYATSELLVQTKLPTPPPEPHFIHQNPKKEPNQQLWASRTPLDREKDNREDRRQRRDRRTRCHLSWRRGVAEMTSWKVCRLRRFSLRIVASESSNHIIRRALGCGSCPRSGGCQGSTVSWVRPEPRPGHLSAPASTSHTIPSSDVVTRGDPPAG